MRSPPRRSTPRVMWSKFPALPMRPAALTRNRALSQRRADTVIRYLVENHSIPLRRIVTPYGFGETNPVAENNSRDGRAQNRRVEVKLLVNKGLMQQAPTMTTSSSGQ